MKLKNLNVQLVQLPANVELILYLIKEELKTTKVYNGLARIGFDACYYESRSSTLILAYMGFEKDDDSLYEFFVKLIDKYSDKIEATNDSIMKCTMKVYVELLNEKKRRSGESDDL